MRNLIFTAAGFAMIAVFAACDTKSTQQHADAATEQTSDVKTEHCRDVIGPWQDPDAVWIGSLFSLSGSQARTNAARRDGVVLAVERINQLGGVPFAASGSAPSRRPLVLVGCDESQSLERAATHLIVDLGVTAVVGPNTSQDTLDLARELGIRHGALLITPTAMASDVAHLLDEDLVWQMVPTTAQRAPFLAQQVEALAERIERARNGVKVAIAYRDDVLGLGIRAALSQLRLNGKPLADPENLGQRVRIDAYDPSRTDQRELVASYAAWRPDLVVLAGTAEAVTEILGPLERAWDAAQAKPPWYVVTDSSKVPELLELAQDVEGLRARVQGVGVVPATASQAVHAAVIDAYRSRFPLASPEISGVTAAYDATCAIAFGMSSAGVSAPTGADLARGLRSLARGAQQVRTDRLEAALPLIAAGEALEPLGTLGTLRWDEDGVVRGATLAVWCIEQSEQGPAFANSGVTYDVETKTTAGAAVACDWLADIPPDPRTAEPGARAADLPPMAAMPAAAPPAAAMPAAAPPMPAEAPPSAANPPAPSQPQMPGPATGVQDGGTPMTDAAMPDSSGEETRDGRLPPVFATVRRDDDWGDGYCDTVTVVNLSPEANAWTVELPIEGTLYDRWNCVPSANSGTVEFRGVDWNRMLGPFQNTEFGFCARRRPGA